MKFSKKIVITCIFVLIIYAIIQIVLSCIFNVELMPTLTQWVYTVFGIELCACALIRIFDREDKEFDIKIEKARKEEERLESLRESEDVVDAIIEEYNNL